MEGLTLLPLNNAHQRGGFLVSNNEFLTDLNSYTIVPIYVESDSESRT